MTTRKDICFQLEISFWVAYTQTISQIDRTHTKMRTSRPITKYKFGDEKLNS